MSDPVANPSEQTPQAERPWWSQLLHVAARVVAWTTVMLAVLVVGAAWMASREETVRWVAEKLVADSGGKIALDDVHGSLLEGVSIGRVHFASDKLAITVEKVALSWLWLPPRRVQVNSLEAQRVVVELLRPSDEPPKPPVSLAMPLSINVSRVVIGELAVVRPASTVTVRHIQGALRANDERIAVDIAHVEAFGLIASGGGRIGATAPFDVTADLNATMPAVPMFAAFTAVAAGPLERIAVDAQARFADTASEPVKAHTVVQPFVANPLGAIDAQAEHVTLAAFGVKLPEAVLSASAHLQIEQGALTGPVEAQNHEVGGLERQRIPIESVAARMRIDSKGVHFEQVLGHVSDAGTIAGAIDIGSDGTRLDLQVKDVLLKAVHAAAVPVRVGGPIRLAFTHGEMHADGKLAGGDLQLDTALTLANRELVFETIGLRAGSGRVDGKGRLALDEARKFSFEANASDFDPSRVAVALDPKSRAAAWLDARIQGRLTVAGNLAPEPAMRVDLAIEHARIAGIDVDGALRGNFSGRAGRFALDDVEADLHMSENSLVARGGFGRDGAVLSYVLSLPRLDRFSRLAGLPMAGAVDINGTATGTAADPVGVVSIAGHDLHAGTGRAALSVATLKGDADVQAGRVRADFTGAGIDTGTGKFPEATLQARGALGDHQVVAHARGEAFGRAVQATLELSGGWFAQGADSAWRGQLVRVENEGRLAVRLLNPAPVEISLARQRAGRTTLAIADGKVDIEQIEHDAGTLRTRGTFDGLAVQALARWFPAFETPKTTLRLNGRWDVAIDGAINGELHVERGQGDLWVATVSSGAIGVDKLTIDATVRNNAAQAQAEFSAKRAGHITASGSTELSKRDGVWGVAGGAPLNWKLDGELTSLAWLGLLVETPLNAEGHIVVAAERSGTAAEPVLHGTVVGERMALRVFDPRAQLTDGRMRLTFDDKRIALEEFVFAGRGGQLAASGVIDLTDKGPDGVVDFAFVQLAPLTDPLYHVVATGAIRVAMSGGQSTITGRLRADEAKLTLRDTTAPTLGGDVVLANGSAAADDTNAARRAFPVSVDLVFELGDKFEVSGYGADAQLEGSIEIDAKAGQPLRAKGAIDVVRGSYFAYGQKLTIERGVLSFSGPIDNPGISFKAERPDLSVTVGVEVTGSLRQPKATLYSQPEMSNTEMLSWLALGHGLDTASRNDLQLLSLAASALLSRGEGLPLQSQLAKTVGLDEITLRGDSGLETSVVAVGKRLSQRLYLSFERSLSGTSTIAKLRYEVGKRWYVQTLTGTENAIDVFFTFTFD